MKNITFKGQGYVTLVIRGSDSGATEVSYRLMDGCPEFIENTAIRQSPEELSIVCKPLSFQTEYPRRKHLDSDYPTMVCADMPLRIEVTVPNVPLGRLSISVCGDEVLLSDTSFAQGASV